jgi:hypothetical protein
MRSHGTTINRQNMAMDPTTNAYNTVAARRMQWDTLLWQVPIMSLTGQAFLFSIALAPGSSQTARTVASALAVIAAWLSITLMTRYRQQELGDAQWLEDFEEKLDPSVRVHGKNFLKIRDSRPFPARERLGIPLLKGYRTWVIGLGLFGLAALLTLVTTWAWPDLLAGK